MSAQGALLVVQVDVHSEHYPAHCLSLLGQRGFQLKGTQGRYGRSAYVLEGPAPAQADEFAAEVRRAELADDPSRLGWVTVLHPTAPPSQAEADAANAEFAELNGREPGLLLRASAQKHVTEVSLWQAWDSLPVLLRATPHLQRLKVRLEDKDFPLLAPYLVALKRLEVTFVDGVTNATVLALGRSCRGLVSLEAKSPKNLDDSAVLALARGCPELETLALGNSSLTGTFFKELARGCPNLRVLDLNNCNKLTRAALADLAAGFPRLTHLDLASVPALRDSEVEALARNSPGLTHVNFNSTQIHTAAVVALAEGCRGLVSVSLFECKEVADPAVLALARCCPKLAAVDLRDCKFAKDDEAVQALAQGCPGLTHVRLLRLERLTDSAVEALARGCPDLASLDLSGCAFVTAAAVQVLADAAKNLRSLELKRCKFASSSEAQEQIRSQLPNCNVAF